MYYAIKSEQRQQQNANPINHTLITLWTKLKKYIKFLWNSDLLYLLFSHLNTMETLGKKKCKQPLARRNRKSCVTLFFLVRHHLISRVAHAKLNKILINPNKLRAYDTTQSS